MNTTTAIKVKRDIGQSLYTFVQRKQPPGHCIFTVDVEDWQLIDEWTSSFGAGTNDYWLFHNSDEMKASFQILKNKPSMCILIAPTSWHDFSHTFKALTKNYTGTIVLLDNSFFAYNLANAGVWEMDEQGVILEEPLCI
jgi:hypothetical protein